MTKRERAKELLLRAREDEAGGGTVEEEEKRELVSMYEDLVRLYGGEP